jgi:hypothetical protein
MSSGALAAMVFSFTQRWEVGHQKIEHFINMNPTPNDRLAACGLACAFYQKNNHGGSVFGDEARPHHRSGRSDNRPLNYRFH